MELQQLNKQKILAHLRIKPFNDCKKHYYRDYCINLIYCPYDFNDCFEKIKSQIANKRWDCEKTMDIYYSNLNNNERQEIKTEFENIKLKNNLPNQADYFKV
jgi:hypothetical protein